MNSPNYFVNDQMLKTILSCFRNNLLSIQIEVTYLSFALLSFFVKLHTFAILYEFMRSCK